MEKIPHPLIAIIPIVVLILLCVGMLAGSWMISGIVPTLIYYGVQIMSPQFFLVSSCIICALISLLSGSSWTTIATIGVALLGIGNALGVSEERIRLIYQSYAPRFSSTFSETEKQQVRSYYGLPERFVLNVGTIERRKNLLLAAKALEHLPSDIQASQQYIRRFRGTDVASQVLDVYRELL